VHVYHSGNGYSTANAPVTICDASRVSPSPCRRSSGRTPGSIAQSLQSSSVRISSQVDAQSKKYARQGPNDSRFVDYFGSADSVVTSSANNDSGMFETNLRDPLAAGVGDGQMTCIPRGRDCSPIKAKSP